MTVEERILTLIRVNPGQRARDISAKLGLDRSVVNSALYGTLRGRVTQDKSYRWWLKETAGIEKGSPEQPAQLDTPLARLCRYYLDCLNHDDQGGLSVFASSQYGSLDYVELDVLPLLSDQADGIFEDEAARRLLNRTRQDRSRLTLVLGYPVRLTKARSRKGWEGFFVEPILLFGFHEDLTNRYAPPTLGDELPQINFKAIRSLTAPDNTSIVEEVVQLAEELGLANAPSELPDLDEIIPRLRAVRPEWHWKEESDLYKLLRLPPLSQITEPGIYNRAVVLAAERSPYTKGLETELAMLQAVPESNYRHTALGDWMSGRNFEADAHGPQALVEVLPLNSEQRLAVLQGLNNPLTVITGPPGTGKSQVVTSLLINAAWQGKTVLFASKNNKAVDVVETRVNGLGPRPVLLRLGSNEYQAKLAEYLVSLLAASASPEDEQRYQESLEVHGDIRRQFQTLEALLADTIQLRNEVDRLEQDVETLRSEVGRDLFTAFKSFDGAAAQRPAHEFTSAVDRAVRSKRSIVANWLWSFMKNGRYRHLAAASKRFSAVAAQLGVRLPDAPPDDRTMDQWAEVARRITIRMDGAGKVRSYFRNLDRLIQGKPLEEISRDYRNLAEKLADTSESLWSTWLRLQPKRLNQTDRRLLKEYSSLLQMIVASNESGEKLGRQVFAKYYSLFPKITSILSCWAVTSLSARGRVPFESGFFDMLIIDEASQCDIASALPLLYRAKRAVIIGDPKQLRHISSLPVKQDRQLLAKHDLVDANAAWAYSVNSLFDLASGLCRSDDIVALRDHHRSHGDIIEFSNQHFYEGRLRVATNYQRLRLFADGNPAVRWVDVRGKVVRPSSGGAINDEEARAVVREIERLVLRQAYAGSIGVVSPFRAQANRIRDLVSQHDALAPRLASMDFLADTVHRFQGDERDVMVFSPVVSSGTTEGALIFLRNNPNLFNVAITRARSALVVVGDRQAALNCGVEYLAHFAEYTSRLGSAMPRPPATIAEYGPEYPPVARPELVSEWERVLYRALFAAGLRPVPQYDLEKYTLDFALRDGDRKLNIEVDGERYHRNWDGELCRRDQIRNQRLIELGWDVIRFWVYQVRDDLQGCVDRVRSWRRGDGQE